MTVGEEALLSILAAPRVQGTACGYGRIAYRREAGNEEIGIADANGEIGIAGANGRSESLMRCLFCFESCIFILLHAALPLPLRTAAGVSRITFSYPEPACAVSEVSRNSFSPWSD